ncbi:MAG: GAF domain-containing protein, partial [Herpetosiphonaceae bacterium]|nr:GAF domain-containing protein [Herpetosiphonaceae bacterium]
MTNRLLSSSHNGAGAIQLPAGWRSVELGEATMPGLLALNLVAEESDDVVTVLGAQISVLWQYVITREEFQRRERAISALTDTLQGLARQLNIDDFLQTAISQATDLLAAAGGGVYLVDVPNQKLELRQVARFSTKNVGTKLAVGEGVVGQVAETGQARLVNNYATSTERSIDLAENTQFSALLAAPLHDDDVIIGVMMLAHVGPAHSFSSSDLALLESFAAQASLALRTARLLDAQRKQARELFVLYENSRTIGSSLDLRHILDRLTENVTLALNVEQSAVFLWEPERAMTELVALAVDESFTGNLQDIKIGTRTPLQSGSVAALVINAQQPVAINDVAHDPRIASQRGALREHGVRSILGVPLLVLDHVIGVLVCTMYTVSRSFSGSEITLAQTLAGQAATAIGNARLLTDERRRSVELTTLQDISTRLNAGSGLTTTLESIGEGVRQLLPNIDIEICLYDPQTETLNSHYATETSRNYFVSESGVYHLDQGLTGWLARHRTTLRIGDMQQQRTVYPVRSNDPAA